MSARPQIPIVDIFAGPGGLGEGFSAYTDARGRQPFKIAVSIEKDELAHRTLLVRSFYRQFPRGEAPAEYYQHLQGNLTFDSFLQQIKDTPHGRQAMAEARCHELGKDRALDDQLSRAIAGQLGNDDCVLIGGPPCQAYSLVGRSRNKGRKGYRFEDDPKATLYLEYLQLIADLWPAVFVMENVKGLLSSQMDGQRIFEQICQDLVDPAEAIKRDSRNRRRAKRQRYRIRALTATGLFGELTPSEFVIHCEDHGIPQARHRVILVGIREDLDARRLPVLTSRRGPSVFDMLQDLPAMRSGLSKERDDPIRWTDAVLELCTLQWQRRLTEVSGLDVASRIAALAVRRSRMEKLTRGGEYVHGSPCIQYERDWFVDPRIKGFCNHSIRSHIRSDLHRYVFASSYADAHPDHISPDLSEFPRELLPKHRNVSEAISGACFGDRFRVQVKSRCSTTITSHISKDGHYYIHPDPRNAEA